MCVRRSRPERIDRILVAGMRPDLGNPPVADVGDMDDRHVEVAIPSGRRHPEQAHGMVFAAKDVVHGPAEGAAQ